MTPLDELLKLTNREDLVEVGGGHNQKGVDFQRHWAVAQMFELERKDTTDFLLLFETIQDIAILDSAETPTSICIYQVKKKDRKEWGWAELTALHQPKPPSIPKTAPRPKALSNVQNSPLGKLYAAVLAFKTLKSAGRFVSNAGCDLPLADGTSAATSLPCALSTISADHLALLSKALETLHPVGTPLPDLSRIHLERAGLPVDDPGTHLVGRVHDFLLTRSPRHAGQARSLVDSLLVIVGRLGARTDHCKTFNELRTERGYSRGDFTNALGKLATVPDLLDHLETWLSKLTLEGVGFLEITGIRAAAAAIYRRQVMGSRSPEEDRLIIACDAWLASQTDPTELKTFFEAAHNTLHAQHQSIRKPELLAHFALRAIQRCVDQT